MLPIIFLSMAVSATIPSHSVDCFNIPHLSTSMYSYNDQLGSSWLSGLDQAYLQTRQDSSVKERLPATLVCRWLLAVELAEMCFEYS